jgi:hypothetical protein
MTSKNMKKLLTVIYFICFSLLFSCKGGVDCDNAEVCVINNTGDVVHFCWGCSYYMDSLMPGEMKCNSVGEIHIDRTTNNSVIAYFTSDHGDYAIEVAECSKKFVLE